MPFFAGGSRCEKNASFEQFCKMFSIGKGSFCQDTLGTHTGKVEKIDDALFPRAGHAEIVQALLQAGADYTAEDKAGATAERGARKGGHTKVEKLLADWARNAREEEL